MVKDINNFYFTDEDYDIFASELQQERNKDLEHKRKEVQKKLLDLNDEILKEIRNSGLELYNHAKPKNITSLIFPCMYNKGKVTWIGVRYGKHPVDIKELNKFLGKTETDTKLGFQKHACMQINVGYSGVDIGIFLAVPYGAVDRWYLQEHLRDNDEDMINKINAEIEKIKGYGFEWNIWNTELEDTDKSPEAIYKFDVENTEDFISWFKRNDCDGCYSSMLVHFPRYSEKINKDNIVETTVNIFKQLYNLYKTISWNIHYNSGKAEL